MGQFLHYISTFVTGFAVAFSMVWRLGLVTLAVFPIIVLVGGVYAFVFTGYTSKNREVYEEAGVIAEQVPKKSPSPPIEQLLQKKVTMILVREKIVEEASLLEVHNSFNLRASLISI